MLEITQSDTINLEVTNIGIKNIDVIAMFSEDPENFDPFFKFRFFNYECRFSSYSFRVFTRNNYFSYWNHIDTGRSKK